MNRPACAPGTCEKKTIVQRRLQPNVDSYFSTYEPDLDWDFSPFDTFLDEWGMEQGRRENEHLAELSGIADTIEKIGEMSLGMGNSGKKRDFHGMDMDLATASGSGMPVGGGEAVLTGRDGQPEDKRVKLEMDDLHKVGEWAMVKYEGASEEVDILGDIHVEDAEKGEGNTEEM